MMADARRRKFDAVVVWKLDRYARSVRHLVTSLDEFTALGIRFISVREALDFGTPLGRAMFTMIATLAELERELIRERVVAGGAPGTGQGQEAWPSARLDRP